MNNIVRAFVVVLSLTGAAASFHGTLNAATQTPNPTKTNRLPVPMCPPSDPNACGIADRN